ncbi:hypothetical protein FY528_07620 [Hymenobacter lutimineralis]|uniref:DUF3300 domain-containing protein n=1 Tax=Hymenobacter lutimineralis TaxID=2606448 RepID=A0A5D6V7M2_9BACT|nr:hypothetical protein [Hymenobacter lutimineralis]TYZ10918.1 hypothetical protein FY528_07620 [Hymenobacter lutimineralis]
MNTPIALRFLLVVAAVTLSSFSAVAQTTTTPPATADVAPSDLVRSLSNTLQLQPHQAQLLRRALATPKGPTLTALQKQFHDGLSPLQLARLEEWEKTAPQALQQRFIALAD